MAIQSTPKIQMHKLHQCKQIVKQVINIVYWMHIQLSFIDSTDYSVEIVEIAECRVHVKKKRGAELTSYLPDCRDCRVCRCRVELSSRPECRSRTGGWAAHRCGFKNIIIKNNFLSFFQKVNV